MKLYNKIILSLVLLSYVGLTAVAQKSDQRTAETKIADIVMQLPAKDTEVLNQLMGELGAIPNAVPSLSGLLAEPGKSDDSKIRFALAGLSFYISQQGKEAEKVQHATAFCRAIESASSDEIKDFLLIQLQYIAGNESVATLASLLGNQRLSDPAARVLVRINTEESNRALLSALDKSTDDKQLIVLTGALGETRYAPALKQITTLVGNKNAGVKKTAMHALAEIASPSSQKVLYKAVQQANFQYEQTDALSSYILYLANLQKAGENALVTKASKTLLDKTNEETQTAAKCAALNFYITSQGEKALPVALQAVTGKNFTYRGAALESLVALNSGSATQALIKIGEQTSNPVLKTEVIRTLGRIRDKAALPLVEQGLKSLDSRVVQASIMAYGNIDRSLSVLPLLAAMNSADKAVVQSAKETLLASKASDLDGRVAAAIMDMNPTAKIVLIEILAQRKASGQAPVVFAQAQSSDKKVALTAKNALKYLVAEKDLPRIAELLNKSSDAKEQLPLQEAFYAAILKSGDADKQTALTIEQMKQSSGKASAYYNVLSMIGSDEGLKIVSDAFNSSNFNEQAAAFDALVRWNGFGAAPVLYKIARTNPEYKDDALASYITKITPSNNTPEQKLLLLRQTFDIVKDDKQLIQVIKEIGKTPTFLSLITAGSYMDHTSSAVQQAAIQAVVQLVQATNGIAGDAVRTIVDKAIGMNKNSEAEYQKEDVMTKVNAWSKETGFVSYADLKALNALYKDRKGQDFELHMDRKLSADAEWETFFVRLTGSQVTVLVNGVPVKNAADALAYWGSEAALFPLVEKQTAGGVEYRDIYFKEVARPQAYVVPGEEQKEGFIPLFNGIDMTGWTGNLRDYIAKDGMIICDPQYGGRGNLYTEKEYADFVLRFDFLLTPAANNGLGIRTPLEGDAAYVGMELQILDNTAEVYKNLKKHQYHGSVYGVIAAERGALNPVGEWNTEEVVAIGNRIKITVNGKVILDGDIKEASENFTKTLDGRAHPGLSNPKGHIGFLGHGSYVSFKNLRIKDLSKK